jgi:hypothetical protein
MEFLSTAEGAEDAERRGAVGGEAEGGGAVGEGEAIFFTTEARSQGEYGSREWAAALDLGARPTLNMINHEG